ncbi:MAG: hypothetical protein ACNA7M_14515 [Roseovarius sp.]
MTARHRQIRVLPNAFGWLVRVVVLCVLVAMISVSAATAHQAETEAASPVAAQTSGIAPLEGCCHAADPTPPHADCAPSVCCSLVGLSGTGGRDMPPPHALPWPHCGPLALLSRFHAPILHPPIAI